MNITVYLGATEGNDPALITAVKALGTWIGSNGHSLVYGGSRCGLMGMLAESVLKAGGQVFGVEPPTFVTLQVTHTEPGVKGNTATNTLKPAVVETGAEIRVPLFINEGDMIRIDTRTCEYMERA